MKSKIVNKNFENVFYSLINNFDVIFWDFDGVIKESLDVKTDAFENLFENHGEDLKKKIRKHHLENIGISRYKKIPIYLQWVDEPLSQSSIDKYCKKFSSSVINNVVESPWVPGFTEFFNSKLNNKINILVTSTPKEEINEILIKLGIKHFFKRVYGGEESKVLSIKNCINEMHLDNELCLMIGDTETDLLAAEKNNINFLLRQTHLNKEFESNKKITKFLNYLD